jgi:hypothetical protein
LSGDSVEGFVAVVAKGSAPLLLFIGGGGMGSSAGLALLTDLTMGVYPVSIAEVLDNRLRVAALTVLSVLAWANS